MTGTLQESWDYGENDGAWLSNDGDWVKQHVTSHGNTINYDITSFSSCLRKYNADDTGTITYYASTDDSNWTELGTYDVADLPSQENSEDPIDARNDENGNSVSVDGSGYYLKIVLSNLSTDAEVAFYGYNPNQSDGDLDNATYPSGTRDHPLTTYVYGTTGSSGYSKKIIGISSYSKISGINSSNINKVNGV